MTAGRTLRIRLPKNSLLPPILGVAGLLVVIWISIQSPVGAPLPWLSLAAWVVLYAAARFLAVSLFRSEFSFSHIFLLAAFFSFDLIIALWIGSAGVIIDQVARTLLHQHMEREARTVRATLDGIGAGLAEVAFSLSLASLAYAAIGGHAPLADAVQPNGWSIAALCVVYAIVVSLVRFALLLDETRLPVREWPRTAARRALLIFPLLLPLPLSLVIAIHYLRTDFALFSAFALLLLLFVVLIYSLSSARAKLEKRGRERASVTAVGQAVVHSLDLPELLEAIHRHLSPLMDARNFYVALYHEDYDELTFPLVYEDGHPARYRSRSAGNGLTEYVLRTGAPLLIPADVAGAVKRLGLDTVPDEEARCWLGVPITIGDRALGVIVVHSHNRFNVYAADDVDLLLTVASHAAVAIENAQLYASMRRRASELAILNSVSTVVGSSLNLDQVMEAIITSVGPVVGCQKAAILQAQEGGRILTPAAARGLSQAFLEQMPTIMRAARGEGSPVTPRSASVSLERQPLIVNDIQSDPRFEPFRALAESEGIRAFADMPLQARDHLIGTLAVYFTEPRRFTVAELDLLTTFANQAAVAVSNASTYAQADQALTRRVEELAALEVIGRELTSMLDFNRVMERVLDAAVESAGATRGLVALYDVDRHTLNLVATHGYPAGVLPETLIEHWPADQGMIGAAIRDRKVMWLEDVRESPTYTANDPAIRSALVVPILRDNQPLGVIDLESTQPAAFDQAAASFIGQLTTQAAVAIRNAQLYQQSQNRLREMSILFDVSRQVTSILDLPELGQELARQLALALGTTHCALELVAPSSDGLELIAEYAAPDSASIPMPHTPGGTLRRLQIDELQRNRQPVIVYTGDALDHAADYEFMRSQKLYALIGLPLIAGNETIGRVIWMHGRQRTPFSADEILFAQTLANQASIAIENARLFRERDRRVNDLSQLYQASLALAASIEFDEALNRILIIARQITDSDSVTVYLYDARADRVIHGSHLAGSDRLFDPLAIRPAGLTRRIITTRQPVLVNDASQEPDTNPRVLEAGIRSVIAMPILRKDQVLGVLYVNSQTRGKYTTDSLQLVQLLANEAAVAIENARLFSEIAEARDRLAAILNSSRDGILMFDLSGQIVVANPMLEQLWGVRRAELEDRYLLDLLDVPDLDLAARLGYTPQTLHSLLKQAAAGVQAGWGKDVFTLPGGSRPRSIERTGLPVLDENRRLVGWMLVLRDVTEERELQAMREDLSNMIIHDLRSPLVAILDSYELIVESAPPSPDEIVAGQALEVGRRSTRKLLDLVNSLLDISRFEHGQVPLDTQFAALRPLAANALEQLAASAKDRGVIVRNEVPAELPLTRVDEDQITRVFINLIDNALKFSPPGGEVVVSARPTTNGHSAPLIECSVRDMGPGIPPEYRERVFERFVQLSDGGPERRRGTGLGLAFCKLAIEAHGGTIRAEAPPDGAGSQFTFTLPVAVLLPHPP